MSVVYRLTRDFVHGWRLFVRRPGSLGGVVVSVGLAVGLSAAILTLVDAVLYPELQIKDPETLAWMTVAESRGGEEVPVSLTVADFESIRDALGPGSVAALTSRSQKLELESGEVRRNTTVAYVSGDYFAVAGAESAGGRLFNEKDQLTDIAVISFDTWQRLFAASPSAVGSEVVIEDRVVKVVGIAARSFGGPTRTRRPAVWLPVGRSSTGSLPVRILGRLATPADRDRMRQVSGAVLANTGRGSLRVNLVPILTGERDARREGVVPAVVLLVIVLIAIAVVNVTTIVATLSAERKSETAVRFALGAGRGALVSQALVETSTVVLSGLVLAALVCHLAISLLMWLFEFPLGLQTSSATLMYLLLLGLGAGVGLVTCIPPVLMALRATGTGIGQRASATVLAGPSLNRSRSIAVAAQVAASVVTVVCATFLTRSSIAAAHVNLGFDTERLLALSGLSIDSDWSSVDAAAYWNSASSALMQSSQVEKVALASHMFGGDYRRVRVSAHGRASVMTLNYVSPEYFEATGIRVIRGRGISEDDVRSGAPVALLSQRAANALYHDESRVVGQELARIGDSAEAVMVVGVVADAVSTDLLELSRPIGTIYRPMQHDALATAVLFIRFSGDPRLAAEHARSALPSVNGRQVPRPLVLRDSIDYQLSVGRMPSRLALVSCMVTVTLTIIGLQALLSLIVRQRTAIVGVHMALGASKGDILKYLLRSVAMPLAAGVIIGAIAAYGVLVAMTSVLFGVSRMDWPSLSVVGCGLVGMIVAAVAMPLYRASRIDPGQALRGASAD